MDLKKLVKTYLNEVKLMQLATSENNQPWVCSVWFAADEDLNIYWFSSTTRRHSKELLKNEKVSAAFTLPHTPQDPPRGLQVEGIAEVVEDQTEIDKIMAFYVDRIFPKQTVVDFMNNKQKPHKFYRLKPSLFVLFDVVNYPEESRQELKM